MLTNITNTIIAITADSENGHEDSGRGELCIESRKRERTNQYSRRERESRGRVAGESREDVLKLCNFFSLLQCVVLSPSQSLNLKALTRTLDETEVSSFQKVVGGETLDILHRYARRSAATAWDASAATAWGA